MNSAVKPTTIRIIESGHYQVKIQAEGAEVFIRGGWHLKNNQKLNVVIDIIHQARHVTSNTLLRAVGQDKASITLSGTIIIEPEGQQANAFLTENVLLLSDTATAQAVPNLEILANEVRCSHAATISKIPEEHLFYLQSRGLERKTAESLIITGFLAEASALVLPENP